jgi:hypothetical protein
MKLSKCFDNNHVFFYKAALYERLQVCDHCAHEFRVILNVDDYDYVEDYALILELRQTADAEGIKY